MINIIYHISDIHINDKLSDDILHSFNLLMVNIKNDKKMGNNCLLVIAGDLFDKAIASPSDASCFNEMIAAIEEAGVETIIIPGNHDFLKRDKDQGDIISSILPKTNRKTKLIKVFNENKIYDYNHYGIEFYVMNPMHDKILELNELKTAPNGQTYLRIAIIHEIVESCYMYESIVDNVKFKLQYLRKFDLVLLGDLHTGKFITDTIAYPGSFVQTSKREPENNHGFIRWDLNKLRKYLEFKKQDQKQNQVPTMDKRMKDKSLIPGEFMEIPLKSAHLTFNLTDAKLNTTYFNGIAKSITVNYSNTEKQVVDEFVKELKNRYNYDKTINRYNLTPTHGMPKSSIITAGVEITEDQLNVETMENQINLMKVIMKEKDFSDEVVEFILDKHLSYRDLLKSKEETARWKLRYLYWDNIMSYGGKNYINFDDCGNIVSITGPNRIGKSAVIDIIYFAIFGKTLRDVKQSELVNNKYKKGRIVCHIEYENELYKIETILQRGVVTKSHTIKKDEKIIPTTEFVKKVFGSKTIFNSIVCKSDLSENFVLAGAKTTKFLCEQLGIDIFDSIISKVKEEDKNTSLRIDFIKKNQKKCVEELQKLIAESLNEIKNLDLEYNEIEKQIKNKEDQNKEIYMKIDKKYVVLDKLSIKELESKIKNLLEKEKISSNTPQPLNKVNPETALEQLKIQNSELKNEIKEIENALSKLPNIPTHLTKQDFELKIPHKAELESKLKLCNEELQTYDKTEYEVKNPKKQTKYDKETLKKLIEKYRDNFVIKYGDQKDSVGKLKNIIEETKKKCKITEPYEIEEVIELEELDENLTTLEEQYTNLKAELNQLNKITNIQQQIEKLEKKKSKNVNSFTFKTSCESCVKNKDHIHSFSKHIDKEIKKLLEIKESQLKLKSTIETIHNEIQNLRTKKEQITQNEYLRIITSRTEQLNKIEKYKKCKADVYCCLINEQSELTKYLEIHNFKQVNETKQELIMKKNNCLDSIASNKYQKNAYKQIINDEKEASSSKIIIETCRYLIEAKKNVMTIEKLKADTKELKIYLDKKKNDIEKYEQDIPIRIEEDKEIQRLDVLRFNLSKYLIILDVKCLRAKILDNFYQKLSYQVNKLIVAVSQNFRVFIKTNPKGGLNISFIDGDSNFILDSKSASSYQRFIIDLFIRISLVNCIEGKYPQFLILDEGFGCMDKENLEAVKELLMDLSRGLTNQIQPPNQNQQTTQQPIKNQLTNKNQKQNEQKINKFIIISHIESVETIATDMINVKKEETSMIKYGNFILPPTCPGIDELNNIDYELLAKLEENTEKTQETSSNGKKNCFSKVDGKFQCLCREGAFASKSAHKTGKRHQSWIAEHSEYTDN